MRLACIGGEIFLRKLSRVMYIGSGLYGRHIRASVERNNFIEKKACIPNLYMVYSNSGQENTKNTVRQAKQISFERNLKKELAKLVRM